jgi:CCR4-NOT complex subunit CAF16
MAAHITGSHYNAMDLEEQQIPYHVNVDNLTFSYPNSSKPVLKDLNVQLAPGARCLLIGANGSGKSTLLRVLAGRHLTKPDGAVTVLGRDAFHDTRLNFERAFLDTDWGMRTVAFAGFGCPLQADIAVSDMMKALQEQFPERRDELIEVLGIDLTWRMHLVSDGQRRRVQIFIGLIRPFKILLLDEVTVSLDVIVRMDLLKWLAKESEERGATILYATHIFDGLDSWPTHVHYLSNGGCTGWQGKLEDLEYYQELRKRGEPSPMLRIAEKWLREELLERKKRLKDGETLEKASGQGVYDIQNTIADIDRGGGFAAGRMASHNFIK